MAGAAGHLLRHFPGGDLPVSCWQHVEYVMI
jgi:hypothetical protein